MELEGIIYFPNASMEFAGGTNSKPSNVFLIGDEVNITGNSAFGATGGSNPVLDANEFLIQSRLVE